MKRVFNLLVVDESGSMSIIERQALVGINETLTTIQKMQKTHKDLEQRVTLITFDSTHKNLFYDNVSARHANPLKSRDYNPCGGTPLYDAIGMGIATLLAPKKYNAEEKEAGKAAILMGCVGITEGAIPFAANDPLRVIPSLIVGAVVGNIIPFLTGVLNHAPWGGLIVLPVVEGRIWYFISVLAGGFVTAIMVNLLKKNNMDDAVVKAVEEDDLDEITFDDL